MDAKRPIKAYSIYIKIKYYIYRNSNDLCLFISMIDELKP